ncbi:NADPH-dependent FMN reductase [Corynebacterium guangdongense]|uniref:NAD(P)H-dependent FMN reductase n=1 Tax=Corynebacterium guangdongense TaxID=1783348 RepID=A0ABU1ZVC8_9CORY|nr:NAD(P)H-dependent oxidoreductase [Corynebacterium guangdongense]MDR7328881.1 NAD(P)H-dependent FMN reductase [Corynebacterium guangdongense]WJZ17456.1 FMN-dependent NADPH-azoreductase [Corynebacterium guangdongense]
MSTIGIIIGSIREGRSGASVAEWIKAQADARTSDVAYELVDLKEFNVPLLDSAVVPGAANKRYDNEAVQNWSDKIDSLDGYIFVTPEYNHSVPGALKNAFDALGAEWAAKPIAFVGYGAAGGVRAVEHWRTIVANFSMIDIRTQLDLSLFTEFTENGFAPNERRAGELEAIFTELEDWAQKLA